METTDLLGGDSPKPTPSFTGRRVSLVVGSHLSLENSADSLRRESGIWICIISPSAVIPIN